MSDKYRGFKKNISYETDYKNLQKKRGFVLTLLK